MNFKNQEKLFWYLAISSTGAWSFVGVQQLVDCLKSLSLALALCECELDVERAVYLSRLEQAFQVDHWGSVEWYHDIDRQETQARAAAATLFVQFCHDFTSVQAKHKSAVVTWCYSDWCYNEALVDWVIIIHHVFY